MTRKHTLIVAMTLWSVFLGGTLAQADTADTKDRAAFYKQVSQRNALYRKLQKLDAKAADRIKQDKTPVAVYADQVALQDQLDLVRLRLEVMANRFDLQVPPLPQKRSDRAGGKDATGAAVDRAFSRGRRRAISELRRQTLSMLSSIDFADFLKQ